MKGCVFCNMRAIEASTPVERFTSRARTYFVFEPLDPVTPGHLLVVCAQHTSDATHDPDITAGGAAVAAQVAQRYDSANIITSIGRPATQSVFHLHWHVVPRSEGDGLPLPWTYQREDPAITEAVAKIRTQLTVASALGPARADIHMQVETSGRAKEINVALTKHGEGSVIPEGDQQKTAGLSKEAAEELRDENEKADGPSDR